VDGARTFEARRPTCLYAALQKQSGDRRGKSEALSYPVAFWGFVLSFAFLVAWGLCAGLSIGLALLLWTSYLIIAIVMSRVVVGGGLLFVHHAHMPLGVVSQLVGSGPGTLLSPAQGVVPAAIIETSFIQDYRGSLMPSFLQSFKLAHDRGINARALFWLLVAVIVISLLISMQMIVRLGMSMAGCSWAVGCMNGGRRWLAAVLTA
jgi:hypothetical protein